MKYIWQIFNCESTQVALGISFLCIYVIYLIKESTYLNSREKKYKMYFNFYVYMGGQKDEN